MEFAKPRALFSEKRSVERRNCNRTLTSEKTQANYGGIAQLGEHLLCKQGVIGSIPIISTKG